MPAPPPPIAASPPTPSGGKAAAPSRGAPDPPGTTFDRVLDQHDQAWTADAGGQQNGPATDAPSDDQQQAAPADLTAALAALVAGPVPMTPPAAPVASGDVAPTPPAQAAVPGVPLAGTATAAVATSVTQPPPADATAVAAPVADVPSPVTANGDGATATAQGGGVDTPAPNASTGNGATGGQHDGDAPQGDAQRARQATDGARIALAGLTPTSSADATPPVTVTPTTPTAATLTPATADGTASAPAVTEPAPSTTEASASVTETSASSAPVTASAAHTAPRTVTAPNPVPVAHAPAALADLVHVAHERGAGSARMVLHPESLGGVEVHLRQTTEGIRATVRVHHPEALQTLQAGLGDLRRGLEDRGVTIDQLDLGLAPGSQDQGQQGNGAARGDGGLPSRTSVTGVSALDDNAADDETLTNPNATTTRAAAGVLVDVMA